MAKIIKLAGSIKLTIILLFSLFLLILFATFAQVDLGIFEANKKYFTSWFIWLHRIPIFLGGYSLGLLLVINLIFSHTTKFSLKKSKIGVYLIHIGLVLIIIGSAFTSWLGHEMQISIKEGTSVNYVDYPTEFEFVIIDQTSTTTDRITAIPLKDLSSNSLNIYGLTITKNHYYPNSYLNQRGIINKKYEQLGQDFKLIPLPKTYKMSEQNIPGLDITITKNGEKFNFLLWGGSAIYQDISHNKVSYLIKLRPKRQYLPFKLELNDFIHETYEKSDTAKAFISKGNVITKTGKIPFEISMNHPLRYQGFTFFQSSFTKDEQTSIFQVVKNPSWLIPYISSFIITLGLLFQMIVSSRRKTI